MTLLKLTDGLALGKNELQSGMISLPAYRAFYLESLVKENGHIPVSYTHLSRRSAVAKEQRRKQLIRKRLIIRCVIGIVAFILGTGTGWLLRGTTIRKAIDLSAIKAPEWIDQQFLTVNPYSRPGTKLAAVNSIVVHYIGNPGTTAQQNRDYFESLKNQSGSNTTSVSSNFIIGMDGEIIQCIPVDEKSFASNNRNSDTISIECCHPGEDGEFTEETLSLIHI